MIRRVMQARERCLVREHNERMSLAWHTAALTRMSKKMPKLDTLLLKGRPASSKPRQTIEQQMAIARMWAARGVGRMSKRT